MSKLSILITKWALVLSLFSETALAKGLPRVILINSQNGEPYTSVQGFIENQLKDKGWIHGKNFEFVVHSLDHFEGLGKRLWEREKNNRVDLVITSGTFATKTMKELLYSEKPIGSKLSNGDSVIPVLFAVVTDPVGVGVIDNFKDAPKGNFSGVSYPAKVAERFRIIKKFIPNVKKMGLIYADMAQSDSYNAWVKEQLTAAEFKDLKVEFRKVPFIKGNGGHKRMAQLAKQHVEELNGMVDVFISPSDQMGTQDAFEKVMFENSKKPLVGISKKGVMQDWGASFSIFGDVLRGSQKVADMASEILNGKSLKTQIPEWPPVGVAVNKKKISKYGIKFTDEMKKLAEENIVE